MICKDCGKSFEFTKSEKILLKSKNLYTSRKCKDCRNNNKTTTYRAKNIKSTTYKARYNNQKKRKSKRNINLPIVIAVIIMILIVAVDITPSFINFDIHKSISTNSEPYISTLTFRTDEYLQEHFEKHGRNMGFGSTDDYLHAANRVISNNKVLVKAQSDSDTAYFLQSSGEFVVLSYDGYIRTYFIPEDGIEYFNKQ